jgi:hypothetical protein
MEPAFSYSGSAQTLIASVKCGVKFREACNLEASNTVIYDAPTSNFESPY